MLFAQFLIEIKEETLCIDAMDLYMAIEFVFFFLAIPRTFFCAYLHQSSEPTHNNRKCVPKSKKTTTTTENTADMTPDISSVFPCVHIHPASILIDDAWKEDNNRH